MKEPKELIGKTEEEALMAIGKAGLTARVMQRDGKVVDDTPGLVKSRVSIWVKGGEVFWAAAG